MYLDELDPGCNLGSVSYREGIMRCPSLSLQTPVPNLCGTLGT